MNKPEIEIPEEIRAWIENELNGLLFEEDLSKLPGSVGFRMAKEMYWKLIEESPGAYWFEKARENLVERNEAKGWLLKLKYALQAILAKDKSFDNPSSGNQDMEHEGRLAGIKKDLEQLINSI